jgi:hypothetical protein
VSAHAESNKVTLCHKNRVTISVASEAVAAHLAHGDALGACSTSPDPANAGASAPISNETCVEEQAADEAAALPPDETTLTLADNSSYRAALLSHDGATWTYQIERVSGKDLSHWVLGIESCVEHISNADTGAELGLDPKTGFAGIKWNTEGGEFSFTLDAVYPSTSVDVVAKAGNGFNATSLIGPDCHAEPVVADTPDDDGSSDTGGGEANTTTVLALDDDVHTAYQVSLVSHEGNTWTYDISHLSGQDLSHWSLGIESCLAHLTDYTEDGADIGADRSTNGFVGIKWNSRGGTYSVTLDRDYPVGEVGVLAKTGNGYVEGTLTGPDCAAQAEPATPPACVIAEDELAEVPAEQQTLAGLLVQYKVKLDGLSVAQQLATLVSAGVPRPLFYSDLLFLPNVTLAVQGGMRQFSALFRLTDSGQFEIQAMLPVNRRAGVVQTSYSWNALELSLPVVDIVADSGKLASYFVELVVIDFAPMQFQVAKARPLHQRQ